MILRYLLSIRHHSLQSHYLALVNVFLLHDLFIFVIVIGGFSIAVFIVRRLFNKKLYKTTSETIPARWITILQQQVPFYAMLSSVEQDHFNQRVMEFLLNHKITEADTKITIEDKLYVAASAIIPIFKFPHWRYSNLDEIIIYPGSFNHQFDTRGKGRNILGMVGNGYMEGKMILSQKALRLGFQNTTDKKNTAIHEFIHLIDKMDGVIDGIPRLLIDRPYIIPWLDMIKQKVEKIYLNESDINPYGGSSQIEFFAVACEYFFERPRLLEKKHPELYNMLENMFAHDLADRRPGLKPTSIGRNASCPCQSGLKYKHCCLA